MNEPRPESVREERDAHHETFSDRVDDRADEIASAAAAGDIEQVSLWRDAWKGLLRNPFFLVELARSGQTGGASTALPTTLRELILRRVGRLPDEVAALLRQAAVAGREFSVEVVASAAGADVDEVDRFMRAADGDLTAEDVRLVAFSITRHGYDVQQVDDILDRLEDEAAARERDRLVAAKGPQAHLEHLSDLADTLQGRLSRPRGRRFRRGARLHDACSGGR